MPNDSTHRELAAIMFTDIAGYTAMMQHNEGETIKAVGRHQEVLEEAIARHGGEILNYYGDGSLSVFRSAVEALRAAREIQVDLQKNPPVPLRIGIHIGEILTEDGKVFGDGVNIASRIESLGQKGTVFFSGEVANKVRNVPEFEMTSLGSFHFKNVNEPIEVFALANQGFPVPDVKSLSGKLALSKAGSDRKRWLAGLIVAITIGFAAIYYFGNLSNGNVQNSLAVLPFENESNDEELNFLCDGIPESLINHLSLVPDFKVISRQASFELRDRMSDLSSIASQLGVETLLVGSLRKAGEDLSVYAELIKAKNNQSLWGQKYRKPISELLNLEEEIATTIVGTLRLRLPAQADKRMQRQSKVDPEAYEHYLRGRFLALGSTRVIMEQALEHYEKSVEIDPDFALGYTGIAGVLTNQAWLSVASRDELVEKARHAAESALKLDPDLPEAHSAASMIQFYFDYDFVNAEVSLQKAIGLSPNNSLAYMRYALLMLATDRQDEAIGYALKSVELDPISVGPSHALGLIYLVNEMYQASADEFTKITELHPNWVWGFIKYGIAEAHKGNHEKALELAKISEELSEGWGSGLVQSWLGRIYKETGQQDLFDRALQRIEDRLEAGQYVDPIPVAEMYALAEDSSKAMEWLEKSVEEKSPNAVYINAMRHTMFSLVADHPQFSQVVNAMQFPN